MEFPWVLCFPCHPAAVLSLSCSGLASVCSAFPMACARWPFVSRGPAAAALALSSVLLSDVTESVLKTSGPPLLSPSPPLHTANPQAFPILFHADMKMRIFIFFLDFLPDSHACFNSAIKHSFLWGFGGTNLLLFPVKTLHYYVKILNFRIFFAFMISDYRNKNYFEILTVV